MTSSDERQSGRTTEQLRNAPPNSIFIWVGDSSHYARDLVRHIGRDDIEVMPRQVLTPNSIRLRGQRRPIIVDHAINMAEYPEASAIIKRTNDYFLPVIGS
jgi:hypothetical protein